MNFQDLKFRELSQVSTTQSIRLVLRKLKHVPSHLGTLLKCWAGVGLGLGISKFPAGADASGLQTKL